MTQVLKGITVSLLESTERLDMTALASRRMQYVSPVMRRQGDPPAGDVPNEPRLAKEREHHKPICSFVQQTKKSFQKFAPTNRTKQGCARLTI